MAVEIRLLGRVEIHGDTGVVRLRRSGERCVLATLALNAQRPVTVTTLVDHLCSGAVQSDKSIETVGTYLRRIRAAIRQAGGGADWLRYDRTTRSCVLDIDLARVDYHRFTALTARACQDSDPVVWQQALRLWRGPALADVRGLWADHRRHTLESERLAACEDLLRHQLAAGRHDEVVRAAMDLVEDSQPSDRLLLLGAQGLAGAGQHAAIRRWVVRVTERMRETTDTSPATEVLEEIERLIARPARRPSARTGAQSSAMFCMRADIPTFTGRDDELRGLLDVVRTVLDGPVRAIAIHAVDGMAGVGKTVFTVHAAHRLADRFPDGNLFLELHGHTPGHTPVRPGEALDSLLRATGVDPTVIPPTVEDRARLWRDRVAGKRILLVLDDAADYDQVRPLLPGTAGSLVLITSRHRLPALEGMLPLSLDVLPPASAVVLLRRVAGLDTDQDDAAMGEVVARCGYLPLAICLAGAQLRAHPLWTVRYLADLLATEHERLGHLQVGDRSVSAAFAMSFHHLPAERQRLFRLLGVHPGPEIDAFAAAALTGGSPHTARQALWGLHAGHLIQETAPGRYQLHDLMRTYARTLATDLDTDALHRVLSYYCRMADTANARLLGSRETAGTAPAHMPAMDTDEAVQEWLTTELPTLIACVLRAAASGCQHLAVRLACALDHFLRLNGYTEQAFQMYRTAAAAAAEIGDLVGQATALASLGALQAQGGDYETGTANLTHALALHTESGHQAGQARALTGLGNVRYARGEYDAAVVSFTRAAELFAALGARQGEIHALINLGHVRYQQGRLDAAADHHTRALASSTALGYRLGQANARHGLGIVQLQRGDYDSAGDNLTRALELYTALGSRLGQANARNGLGILRHRRGEFGAASEELTDALTLFAAQSDPDGVAETLNNLGELALDHPDAGDPQDYFGRARMIAREIGAVMHDARALAGQAQCQLRNGNTDEAVMLLREAQSRYESLGVPQAIQVAHTLAVVQGRSAAECSVEEGQRRS
ncbi:MAG TPA: tetratricopeptide repeat protein [Pseudonocardiaceae bacterium]